MEDPESTSRERRRRGQDVDQGEDPKLLMSSKPLHRFVQREPKSLGIVILIFGCAELMMGFQLVSQMERYSMVLQYHLWQGALYVVCGNLSIYTGAHPSKKMVTVCLAMYVVAVLGTVITFGFRIHFLMYLIFSHMYNDHRSPELIYKICEIEVILFLSCLCVTPLLIALSVIARSALKSTRSQVIVQWVAPPPPPSDTTAS